MDKLENYNNLFTQWLQYYGFEPLNVHSESGADKVFRRSRVEATKFGKVDFYICSKYIPNATPALMGEFSTKMFTLANRHRSGAPLGFGATLQVFPHIITENITNELAEYVKSSYCPKHFAASEFPSVVDLNTGYVYYYQTTPIWGYAYYGGYRRDSYNFFSPDAWKSVSNKIQ
ncbi:MAG TPA: hypothetical protein VJ455_08710 [Ignavibacteria bacterium]|nr:hypothetical protein [Ignavibacteria bacterium]